MEKLKNGDQVLAQYIWHCGGGGKKFDIEGGGEIGHGGGGEFDMDSLNQNHAQSRLGQSKFE